MFIQAGMCAHSVSVGAWTSGGLVAAQKKYGPGSNEPCLKLQKK